MSEADYHHEHYTANRERYIANALLRKQAVSAERAGFLIDFFRTRHCVDCGDDDPLVLEFDHLENKLFNISKGLRDRSWQTVIDEIGKCDVVCANCHRRRTARRGRFARGGSSTVEPRPSKAMMRVRFPSAACTAASPPVPIMPPGGQGGVSLVGNPGRFHGGEEVIPQSP